MRRRVQPVRGRQRGGALRPDPYPDRNDGRLVGRARCVEITGDECLGPTLAASNSNVRQFVASLVNWRQ